MYDPQLDAVVLDEADVLLPPPPKVRGSGPAGNRRNSGRGGGRSEAEDRSGSGRKKNKEPDLPTVKLLRYVALHNDHDAFQVGARGCTPPQTHKHVKMQHTNNMKHAVLSSLITQLHLKNATL